MKLHQTHISAEVIPQTHSVLFEAFSINTSADILYEGSSIGLPTETSLFRLCQSYSIDWKAIRQSSEIVHIFLLDHDRKRMPTVYKQNESYKISVKGAPESVLPPALSLLIRTVMFYNELNQLKYMI